MSEYFDMGAHTFYVWLAYGVSLFSLAYITFDSMLSRRKAKQTASNKIRRLKQFES